MNAFLEFVLLDILVLMTSVKRFVIVTRDLVAKQRLVFLIMGKSVIVSRVEIHVPTVKIADMVAIVITVLVSLILVTQYLAQQA